MNDLMKECNRLADDVYRAEVARVEAAGLVADEAAIQEVVSRVILEKLEATPDATAQLQREVANKVYGQAHRRMVDEGKRRISELTSGQLRFTDLDDLDFVVPLGEGQISTFGNINNERVDMADQMQKQILFRHQESYRSFSDGIVYPVKAALRKTPDGTVKTAIEQGYLT